MNATDFAKSADGASKPDELKQATLDLREVLLAARKEAIAAGLCPEDKPMDLTLWSQSALALMTAAVSHPDRKGTPAPLFEMLELAAFAHQHLAILTVFAEFAILTGLQAARENHIR